MASLENTKIKDTYPSLLKTVDNAEIDGAVEISDGKGNGTGVTISNDGQVTTEGTVTFGSLKDGGEDITVTKFVDEADGISNNDNDTSIPTSAAIKDYVDTALTAEDLDFSGNNGTGDVDLDSEVFAITGSNGITTTALDNTLDIDGSTLQTSISTNASNIASNDTDIAALDTRVTTNETNISSNDTDIATNAANISTNATNIASNDTDISALDTRVTTAESNISSNDTDIATNASAIATNAANISSNDTDIAALDTRVTTNESSITTNATNIASNDTDISSLQTDVSTNATNIASNDSDISALQTDVSTNTTNISTNATNIASNDTDIATNAANIATNASNISSNDTDIATNATNIATNTTNISTNATNIATNETDIISNGNDIATNTSNISTNATNIASNDSDISALQTDVSTNTTNIANNGQDIATNTTNISTNATNIASNDTDIATNASNISTNTSNISTNTSNISTNTSNISTNTTNITNNANDIADLQTDVSSNSTSISANTTAITGKVAKAGDTMTGDLNVTSSSSGERKIVIGNTDGSQTSNDYSRIHLTGKSSTSSSTTGAEVILNTGGSGQARVLFNTEYSFSQPSGYYSGYVGYSGGNNSVMYLQHGPTTGAKNTISMNFDSTFFNKPLRIGGNVAANELDDFEEGTANLEFGLSYYYPGSTITFSSGTDFASWTNNSKYVKIGSLVTVFIDIVYNDSQQAPTNWGSSSYRVWLGGLPFTVQGSYTSQYQATNPLHGNYAYGRGMTNASTNNGWQIRPFKWGTYGMYYGFTQSGSVATPLAANDFKYTISGQSQNGLRQVTGVIQFRTT